MFLILKKIYGYRKIQVVKCQQYLSLRDTVTIIFNYFRKYLYAFPKFCLMNLPCLHNQNQENMH